MASPTSTPLTGHCSCNAVTYTLACPPLITHICYCTWCQREAGSLCALNALIESTSFTWTVAPGISQPIVFVPGPTPSGNGQTAARCPVCLDALWKYYGDARHVTYVKAGTLDGESFQRVMQGERVHIYTGTKPSWVDLEAERRAGIAVCEEYYVREQVWSREALARREKLMEVVSGKGA